MGKPETGPQDFESADKGAINVYPKYFPKERLAELADVLLGPKDPSAQPSNVVERSIQWTDPETKAIYVLKKGDRVDTSFMGTYYSHNVVIQHTAPNLPLGTITNQYLLESNAQTASENNYKPIRQTHRDGKALGTPIVDEFVIQDALSILYNKPTQAGQPTATKIAENLLQNRVDSSFKEEIVGEYLLSDHAVVNGYNQQLTKITKQIVLQTVTEFAAHIKNIENEEKTKSLENLNQSIRALNSFKNSMSATTADKKKLEKIEAKHSKTKDVHMAVVDAIESSPIDGRHGSRYTHPNLARAATRVSGRLPNGKWNNVVMVTDTAEHEMITDSETNHKKDKKKSKANKKKEPDIEDTQPIDISKLNLDDENEL